MNWKKISLYVGLPVTILILYLGGMILVPYPGQKLGNVVFSERGIIEIGTAAFFFLAALFAFLLWYKTAFSKVGKWRVIYLLLGLAVLFVALEEINYGQFFFEFETPQHLSKYSSKDEFNLHNLFANKPAHRLNLIATIGFPVFFIVLPLIAFRSQNSYCPQNWTYYFLPQRQLLLFVIIGQLMTWFDDVFEFFGIKNTWTAEATETKELYWALAVLLWMIILFRRIVLQTESATDFSGTLLASEHNEMVGSVK